MPEQIDEPDPQRREDREDWESGEVEILGVRALLVSLAFSAFGILAIYVVGTDTQQTCAINQVFGFFVELAGAVPLALKDYGFWRRHLRLIYGLVLIMLLAVLMMGAAAGGVQQWTSVWCRYSPRSLPSWAW